MFLSQDKPIYFSKAFLFQRILPPFESDEYSSHFKNFKVFLYDKDDNNIASGTIVSYETLQEISNSYITLKEENNNKIYKDFSKIGFEITIEDLITLLSKIQNKYDDQYYKDHDLEFIKTGYSIEVKNVNLEYRGGETWKNN